jgi:hypothetical protein
MRNVTGPSGSVVVSKSRNALLSSAATLNCPSFGSYPVAGRSSAFCMLLPSISNRTTLLTIAYSAGATVTCAAKVRGGSGPGPGMGVGLAVPGSGEGAGSGSITGGVPPSLSPLPPPEGGGSGAGESVPGSGEGEGLGVGSGGEVEVAVGSAPALGLCPFYASALPPPAPPQALKNTTKRMDVNQQLLRLYMISPAGTAKWSKSC